MNRILYTKKEGGYFRPLELEKTDEEILFEVEANRWDSPGEFSWFYTKPYSETTGDNDEKILCHGVMFQDGRQWDSINKMRVRENVPDGLDPLILTHQDFENAWEKLTKKQKE
jgi:hypothetical protein